jgi:hypothetical protein
MNNRPIVIGLSCMALVLAIAGAVQHSKEPTLPQPIVSAWKQTPPPIGVPFVGFWVDGSVQTEFAIHYGTQFWEYAPTLKPPIGQCLGALPPAFWVEAPGSAE